MLKKAFIVVVCLVTVCAVLGLNDRLDYDGLTDVFGYVDIQGVAHDGMISGNVNDITDDFYFFSAIGDVVEHYTPNTSIYATYFRGQHGDAVVSVHFTDGENDTILQYNMSSPVKAKQLCTVLNAFSQDGKPSGDTLWADILTAVHYIGFTLDIVASGVMTVGIIFFDITDTVFVCIHGIFYLLGLI